MRRHCLPKTLLNLTHSSAEHHTFILAPAQVFPVLLTPFPSYTGPMEELAGSI